MRLSQPRALAMIALFALTLAACSGGGGISSQPQSLSPTVPGGGPGPGSTGTADLFTLSPSGATHTLKLPQGYSGILSIGPNRAPAGTNMRIDLAAGMGGGDGRTMIAAPPVDPFPIVFSIRLPITITLPIFGFTLCLPRSVNVSGTFDVSIFDPTKAISPPLNPVVLGHAVVTPAPVGPAPRGSCPGPTLTFTPTPGTTFSFVRGVSYPLTIARNVSADYAGGASTVVLPVQSNTDQPLAPTGPFGAGVNYSASSTSGFLQWTNINGVPNGISPLIYNDDPIQSLVVTATQALSLNSVQVEVNFTSSSSSSSAFTRRTIMARDTATPPPTGTFVPDPSLPAYGPFPATVSGNQATFTVTPDAPLALGGTKAWDFSLVTVTACVPVNVFATCDSPSTSNVATTVPLGQQFEFLVSDASGLLTGHYTASVTGACSTDGINEDDNSGDNPPNYHDDTTGPNAEFEVNAANTSGTCDIVVNYNGSAVAETSVAVGSAALVFKRNTLRPPVNGPKGYAVPGHGATPAP